MTASPSSGETAAEGGGVPGLVSVVIPTYNRARDLCVALKTVLAQTVPARVIEILVVDDGSTDDTAEVLRREFGDRVRYLFKENGGVSSARNRGLAAARGAFLALLDSDDEWLPTHLEAQLELLDRRPELGMVLTDVVMMDAGRRELGVLRRRKAIPEDGPALRWVLREPRLIPASATFRRAVYEKTGAFDETLRTAEDLDFHLRVALDFGIGVVEQPLTRVMRGHDGLSALRQTSWDYLHVIERFVARNRERIPARHRDAALLRAYAENARGFFYQGDVRSSLRCAGRSLARARGFADAPVLGRMALDLARAGLARARRLFRRSAGTGL